MSKLCDAIREDLSAYIDGMLSEDEAKKVEQHLAACSECRKEHQFLSAVLHSAASMPTISVSDRFHEELHNKLVAEASKPKAIKIRKRPIWKMASGFVAAVAVIAISVVSFSSLPKQSELTPFVPTPSVNQLENNDNAHTTVPTIEPEENTKQKSAEQQKPAPAVDFSQSAPAEEPPVESETMMRETTVPETALAEEKTVNGSVEAADVMADQTASAGGMVRTANVFMKTGIHYYVKEESFSMALELLSAYQQEGNEYLIPDEDLTAVCGELETLEGYTGHRNTAETLEEPTQEQIDIYTTHTAIVIEKSE